MMFVYYCNCRSSVYLLNLLWFQSLARLKDDVLANKVPEGSSSPDVSTLSLPPFERLNTASQTDLSGEVCIEIFSYRIWFTRFSKQINVKSRLNKWVDCYAQVCLFSTVRGT